MRTNSLQRRPPANRFVSYGLRYLVLTIVALLFLFPFIWMVSGSFKANTEVLANPPTLLPRIVKWQNYQEVFSYQPFARQFLNSVGILVVVVLLTVIVATASGYALSKVRVPGASIIFFVLLAAIYVPQESTLAPIYQLFSDWGMIDSLTPIVLLSVFTSTGLIATFVMRQAFLGLAPEYGEAATIDGAGRWRVMLQVYLPMVRPSIAAVVVLISFYTWNSFLYPLVILRSRTNYTVPLSISQYEDIYSGPLWSIQLAAATLSVIPVVVVFLAAQKHVVAGLTAGGLK